MAPLSIPPELKKITQFIRRAEELDRDNSRPQSRIMAYYCRQYAVQSGIKLSNAPEARNCLSGILSELESEKKAMSAFTQNECYSICRKFALEVFDVADKEDREGNAGKKTAKAFYAAGVFLEVLNQFPEVEEDSEVGEKRVYAKWKATEILKAIKEGREITPGGYGEMEQFQELRNEVQDNNANTPDQDQQQDTVVPPQPPSSSMQHQDYDDYDDVPPPVPHRPPPTYHHDIPDEEGTEVDIDLGPPPPSYRTLPTLQPPINEDEEEPVIPSPPHSPVRTSPKKEESSSPSRSSIWKKTKQALSPSSSALNGNPSTKKDAIDDAVELTQFALAALEDRDVKLGRSRLQQALQCLGRYYNTSNTYFFHKMKGKPTPPRKMVSDNPTKSFDRSMQLTNSALDALVKSRDAKSSMKHLSSAIACLDHVN